MGFDTIEINLVSFYFTMFYCTQNGFLFSIEQSKRAGTQVLIGPLANIPCQIGILDFVILSIT